MSSLHEQNVKTLLVDAGNYRIKLLEVGSDRAAVAYNNDRSEKFFSDVRDQKQPLRLVVSSVRSRSFEKQLTRITEGWAYPVWFISVNDIQDFQTLYRQPERLGLDRYLAMLGAMNKYPLPLIVVDAGTVVTIDMINEQGIHTGGMFFPGLNNLRSAVVDRADLLNSIPCLHEMKLPGRTTEDCICSGALTGWHSAISGIIDAMICDDVFVVICGGEGSRYLSLSGREYQSDPGLVFDGMKTVMIWRDK